jgi:dsRNA-specific ribonuclease
LEGKKNQNEKRGREEEEALDVLFRGCPPEKREEAKLFFKRLRGRENANDIAYRLKRADLEETICPGYTVFVVKRNGEVCVTRHLKDGEKYLFHSLVANFDENHSDFVPDWPYPYFLANPMGLKREEGVDVVVVGVAKANKDDENIDEVDFCDESEGLALVDNVHNFCSLLKQEGDSLRNWKAELNEYSQKHGLAKPIYQIVSKSGEDDSPVFVVEARCKDYRGEGKGCSKKEAERLAARAVVIEIEIVEGSLTSKAPKGISANEESTEEEEVSGASVGLSDKNWVGELLEFFQKRQLKTPEYETVSQTGPDHESEFTEAVYVELSGKGEGFTKKEAESKAAENILSLLRHRIPSEKTPKVELQNFTQNRQFLTPQYDSEKSGPDNAPRFTVSGSIKISAKGTGATKKQARMEAAREMIGQLIL